jgi:hypothetical protein
MASAERALSGWGWRLYLDLRGFGSGVTITIEIELIPLELVATVIPLVILAFLMLACVSCFGCG